MKTMNVKRRAGTIVAATVVVLAHVTAPSARGAETTAPELVIESADKVVISVDTGKVIRQKLPDSLFGFNIRWNNFQSDLWDAARSEVYPSVVTAMAPFVGAVYRYPGGTVANSYDWEEAHRPIEARRTLNADRPRNQAAPLFGIDEYFAFVDHVKGVPLYTVNLLGREVGRDVTEFPSAQLADSNRRLAALLKERLQPQSIPRWYQLGNELDRGRTEWSHDKYVSRASDSMKAMLDADPDAHFMAFVREFNWKYRLPGHNGMSRYDDFIRDVMRGLPKVDDLSLNLYYDGALREGGKFLAMDEVLAKFEKVLAVAREARSGKPVGLWVTEHSRRIGGEDENYQGRSKTLASGLGGALSTADFLIGVAQVPEVRGASWHALNGVDRQLFEPSGDEPKPSAVYWALRVLRNAPASAVVSTRTSSPNTSRYAGGYDVRAAAIASATDGPLTVWTVNRADRALPATLKVPSWKGRKVSVQQYFVAGKDGVAADDIGGDYRRELEPKIVAAQFDGEGALAVTLPSSSVSTWTITAAK